MKIHELKTWPEFFKDVISGAKTFELRKDDRGFRAGDILWLREWTQKEGYTGRETKRKILYVLSGLGLEKGYVCMALSQTGMA